MSKELKIKMDNETAAKLVAAIDTMNANPDCSTKNFPRMTYVAERVEGEVVLTVRGEDVMDFYILEQLSPNILV